MTGSEPITLLKGYLLKPDTSIKLFGSKWKERFFKLSPPETLYYGRNENVPVFKHIHLEGVKAERCSPFDPIRERLPRNGDHDVFALHLPQQQHPLYLCTKGNKTQTSTELLNDWVSAINYRHSSTALRPHHSPFPVSTLHRLAETNPDNKFDLVSSPFCPKKEPPKSLLSDSFSTPLTPSIMNDSAQSLNSPSTPSVSDVLSTYDPPTLPSTSIIDWNGIWQSYLIVPEPPLPCKFSLLPVSFDSNESPEETWEKSVNDFTQRSNVLLEEYKAQISAQLDNIFDLVGKFSKTCSSSVETIIDEYCLLFTERSIIPSIVSNTVSGALGDDPELTVFSKAHDLEKKKKKKNSGGFYGSGYDSFTNNFVDLSRRNNFEDRCYESSGIIIQLCTAKSKPEDESNSFDDPFMDPLSKLIESPDEDAFAELLASSEVENSGVLACIQVFKSLIYYKPRLDYLIACSEGKKLPLNDPSLDLLGSISEFNKYSDELISFKSHVLIPLSVTVEYKGFKAICRAKADITSKIFGVSGDEDTDFIINSEYKNSTKLQSELSFLSDFLGLKPHNVHLTDLNIPTSLSVEVDIYSSTKPDVFYLTELSRITPPLIINDNLNSSNSRNISRMSSVLLLSLKYILKQNLALNSDTFLSENVNTADEEELKKVALLVSDLQSNLIEDFDCYKNKIFAPCHVTSVIKSRGLPLASTLSKIVTSSKIPSMRNLAIVEIFAQIIHSEFKVGLRRTQRNFRVTEHSKLNQNSYFNVSSFPTESYDFPGSLGFSSGGGLGFSDFIMNSVADLTLDDKRKHFKLEVESNIVDFFNLIFGSGVEVDQAWNELIIPRMSSEFNVSLAKSDVILHSLFLRLQELTGVWFNDTNNYSLGINSTPNPFTTEDILEISSVVELPVLIGLPNQSLIKSQSFSDWFDVNFETRRLDYWLLEESVNSEISSANFSNAIDLVQDYLKLEKYLYGLRGPDTTSLLTLLSKVYYESNELDYCELYANSALALTHRWSFYSIPVFTCFSKIIKPNSSNSEIIKQLNNSLDTCKKVSLFCFDEEDVILLDTLLAISIALTKFNLRAQADIYFGQLVRMSQRLLGSVHPLTAEYLNYFGENSLKMGNLDSALKAFETSFSIFSTIKSSKSAETCLLIAKARFLRGEHSMVLNTITGIVSDLIEIHGSRHPLSLTAKHLECEVLVSMGQYLPVVKKYDELIEILKEIEETPGQSIIFDGESVEVVDLIQRFITTNIKCYLKSLSRKRMSIVSHLSLKKAEAVDEDTIGELIATIYSRTVFNYLSELFENIELGYTEAMTTLKILMDLISDSDILVSSYVPPPPVIIPDSPFYSNDRFLFD
ncbi:hypothetical protein RCL1_004380 [Eukaryota sp. TZLM3-RCL]